jgi:exodeoxyribonuclease VII large subunit
MTNQYIFTVSELNNQINTLVESNFSNIYVKGEISQLTKHPNGHMYFNIKDESATLPCAMFYYQKKITNYTPNIGDKVLVEGKSSFWVKGGSLKFLVNKISLSGQGDLWAKYEALKKDLLSKGLFDLNHKKALPKYPQKIGLITSLSGSVIKDIFEVINRNSPYLKVVVRDTRMQGDEAVYDLINAIDDFHQANIGIDVIIIARGGGSIEDLWCFNNEKLAYRIFESNIPIISAIGHETDTTISDLVSDKRAGTPSIAAEIVAPSVTQCIQNLDFYHDSILSKINNKVENYNTQLLNVKKRHGLHKVKYVLSNYYDKISRIHLSISNLRFKKYIDIKNDNLITISNNINDRIKSKYNAIKEKIFHLEAISKSLNPKNVLKRGYSLVFDDEGNIVTNIENIKNEDKLDVKLYKGNLKVEVLKTIKKES